MYNWFLEITRTLVQYISYKCTSHFWKSIVHLYYCTSTSDFWESHVNFWDTYSTMSTLVIALIGKVSLQYNSIFFVFIQCIETFWSYCTGTTRSVLYISILSLLSVVCRLCTIVQNRCSIVVICFIKAQRPKFNANISNLRGPKKIGQGPKFGPGAHGMDNPVVLYTRRSGNHNLVASPLRSGFNPETLAIAYPIIVLVDTITKFW